MLCQRCKKATATVHLTDIPKHSGDKIERHLCDDCALAEGVTFKPHLPPLNELLTNFVLSQAQALDELRCDECGTTFSEFRSQGLLGCPNDYVAFEEVLSPLIAQAHENGTHHVGKIPPTRPRSEVRQRELARLKRELGAAVAREDYETAARLRDQIKTAESAGAPGRP